MFLVGAFLFLGTFLARPRFRGLRMWAFEIIRGRTTC
jgi:hypothetical protein